MAIVKRLKNSDGNSVSSKLRPIHINGRLIISDFKGISPMAKYGGNRYGGGTYGGNTFGGNKFGASAPKDKEKKTTTWSGVTGVHTRGWAGESARAKSSPVKGTVRDTGAGYTGAKGNVPAAPAKSAKMNATVSAPKAAPKIGAWKTTVKPAKAASSGSIDNRKPGRNRDELGAFYLNATSGMDILDKKKKR